MVTNIQLKNRKCTVRDPKTLRRKRSVRRIETDRINNQEGEGVTEVFNTKRYGL